MALQHPKVTLIANALGTPPAEMIKHIHDEGRKVAALCGSPSQARKHADAGVDIIIAQGGEAGGHCGEVGSIVLWPQVVKEVAPVPVLAAGGIGSGRADRRRAGTGRAGRVDRLAVADGRGSRAHRRFSSRPTPRRPAATPCAAGRSPASRPACCATTGPRPGRQPDNPKPLGMPLQYMVSGMAVAATHKYPNESVDVAFNPVGQVVGQLDQGGEVVGRHPALGAGIPRGDEQAGRTQRSRVASEPTAPVPAVPRAAAAPVREPAPGRRSIGAAGVGSG